MFQNATRYSMTALENIILSDIYSPVTDERVQFACKMSQTDDIIKEWDKGLDTSLTNVLIVRARNYREVNGSVFRLQERFIERQILCFSMSLQHHLIHWQNTGFLRISTIFSKTAAL